MGQQLLAVSHKYQVLRLSLWCESQLCECISVEHVCPLLCQAHLYEAKELEKTCLEFIRVNMNDVANTDAFASLGNKWPQVSLKITLHNAFVPDGTAASVVEKQENAR